MTTKSNTGGGNFEALLAEIQGASDETADLAKSLAEGDAARIEGAADEADEDAKAKADAEGGDGDDGEGDDEAVMGKALTMTDADGNPVEAIDATELLKSLQAEVEHIGANSNKGLSAILGLVKSQGDLIKSMSTQMAALGAQGRGRRAVLAVTEKPGGSTDLAKSLAAEAGGESADAGMPRQEFLAKAIQAAEQGLISFHDANLAETMINRGQQPAPGVVQAVAKVAAKEA